MLEKYIALYLILTLLFSYIVSFYLQKRFPSQNDKNRELDIQRLEPFKEKPFHRFLLKASLYKTNRVMITLFIFLFNMAIPLLGWIFTIWIAWYFTHIKYEKKVVFTNILDLYEFKTHFLEVERVFGEGSLLNLLDNEYVPKTKKLRALATLASTSSPVSLAIIKQTLSSTDDEIRLYGYSILNNLEKKINTQINTNLEVINKINKYATKTKEDEALIAKAAVNLAFSYWELVYMELSHESLKNNFLNSSVHYIKIAKKFYLDELHKLQKNPNYSTEEENEELYETLENLYMLKGKIFLYKGEYEKAQSELTIANELAHENATYIILYLAEAYYNLKKYNITKSILNQYKFLRFNAKIYPIIQQWETQSA